MDSKPLILNASLAANISLIFVAHLDQFPWLPVAGIYEDNALHRIRAGLEIPVNCLNRVLK
ncbi:hypothetical protein ISP19_19525 [Dyella flava]|uniref:Uncharacterized protein n=1 Tax=Dyella flava TaxID=1920170 RepID=A0ABS2K9N0_9GAMM|nr:hypothetical protein [Dyella flava]